jgi:large subunit ribosomal protein L18
MKASCNYNMPFRRRIEQKTNYKKRIALIKSGKPRLVVRGTNNNFIAEFIEYNPKGDTVICFTHSNELKKYGWKTHKGNLPSAYLTGFLCGKKAIKKIKEANLDIGLTTPVHGSRVFAALKGAIDAGIKINADEKVFPKEERIKGTHCSKNLETEFETVKKQIQEKVKSNE